ncbi:hypothetical protein AB837_00225 [bacterium AB1]|nr:hypothetical protein AB837_00225 [bacterium AB1]
MNIYVKEERILSKKNQTEDHIKYIYQLIESLLMINIFNFLVFVIYVIYNVCKSK